LGGEESIDDSMVTDGVPLPSIALSSIAEVAVSTSASTASAGTSGTQATESIGISLKLSRNQWGGKRSRPPDEMDTVASRDSDYIIPAAAPVPQKRQKLKLVL